MCSLSSSLHLNLLQELVTQVIEATPTGEPSNPNDAQLDLSYEMPRFYIMQIKCFRQNLPPSFANMGIFLPPVVDEVQAFRISDPKFIKLNVGYVARTRRLCRRIRPDVTPVRTPAWDSSRIRSNKSGDVNQHQEESWLPYRKGETGKRRRLTTVIVVAGERVIAGGRVSLLEFRWGKKRKWYYAQICDCWLSPAKGLSPVEG
ncbi:hypothetical protein FXO38_11021 [Capsicum annuum]|nr:hypothetical protein FXO37_34812 [Capsicum annuum]KAF3662741.1 hypothetical protein FXO38_11021 [Capsicum annuum]